MRSSFIYFILFTLLLCSCRTVKVATDRDVEEIKSGTIVKMDTTTTKYILHIAEKFHRDTIVERVITQEEIVRNAITERVDTLYIIKEKEAGEQINTKEITPEKSFVQQSTKLMWAIAIVVLVVCILIVLLRLRK